MKSRPTISDEQRRALEQLQGQPLYLVDTNTQEEYVLLPEVSYRRAHALFDDEFDVSDTYTALEETLKQVWDDPTLDAYSEPDSD